MTEFGHLAARGHPELFQLGEPALQDRVRHLAAFAVHGVVGQHVGLMHVDDLDDGAALGGQARRGRGDPGG